tara:strand:- start:535 stop:1368 length:834 start_codon:yes stop_codon:yes gene_type:complete
LNYLLFYTGKIPDYINHTIDSILKVEDESCNIYFCGDDNLNRRDIHFIQKQDISNDMIEEAVSKNYFKDETNLLWESSFLRIFYLHELAKELGLENFVHFDCDVLIYKSFKNIQNSFVKDRLNITPVNELFLNFSYAYVDNIMNFQKICMCLLEILNNSSHYEEKYYSGKRLNEMIMLNIAYIKYPNLFNLLNTLPKNSSEFIFDPGSYGQYLGGVDKHSFSKKLVNDEHYVGRNIIKYGYKIKMVKGLPVVSVKDEDFELVNLHVHKKNLGKFISK